MKKLHKITVLLLLVSLFFGSVNVSQICAKPKAEAEEEDEEILLDDNELDSWEEEEEVWDDDEEYDEEDLYDDDEGDDDTIRLTTTINKKWKNHYKAEVTLKNLTDASIDDWTIGFQCKDEIEKISKAKIIGYQNNYYYVQSLDGRQDIKANGKVTFEITVKYKGTMNEINSEFSADDCEINKDNYSAAYIEHPMWKDGVSGEIKIQNKSNKKIKDWRILFTSNVKNWKMLNAGIVCQYLNDSNEMTYIVKGTKENKDMDANKNASVYFTAQTDKTAVKVTPQKLYKKDVDAEEWQGQEESAELTEDDFMEYSDYLAYLELQKEEKKKEQKKEKWKEKEADILMKLKVGNTVMGVVVGAAFEKVFEILVEK